MEGNNEGTSMEFEIQHGKQKYAHAFPLTSTIGEVKGWLYDKAKVAPCNQLLFLNAPVIMRFRKISGASKNKNVHEPRSEGGKTNGSANALQEDEIISTPLSDIISPSLLEKVKHLESTPRSQCIKVRGILIGPAQQDSGMQVQQLTTEVASALSRTISTTLEKEGSWYRCSYSQGYVRQTAYVCRTCVEEGRAAPDHAICFACTEICHANHNVEEWGMRYHMRCDCCTSKCWRSPTASSPSAKLIQSGSQGKEDEKGDSARSTLSNSQAKSFSGDPPRGAWSSHREDLGCASLGNINVKMKGGGRKEAENMHSMEVQGSMPPISIVTTKRVEARTNRKRSRSPLSQPHGGCAISSDTMTRGSGTSNFPSLGTMCNFSKEEKETGNISKAGLEMTNTDKNSASQSHSPLPASPVKDSSTCANTTAAGNVRGGIAAASSSLHLNKESEISTPATLPQPVAMGFHSSESSVNSMTEEVGGERIELSSVPVSSTQSLQLPACSGNSGGRQEDRSEQKCALSSSATITPITSSSASSSSTSFRVTTPFPKGQEGRTPSIPCASSPTLSSFYGCRFILDSQTNSRPAIIIPPNAKNRYPRRPETWCYCEEDGSYEKEEGKETLAQGEEEKEREGSEKECLGLSCILCTSCFWSDHVVSLHSDQLKRVSCYGQVSDVDVLIFYCITCETFVCPPCRYRCHKDHIIDKERILTTDLGKKMLEKKKEKLAREAALPSSGSKDNANTECSEILSPWTYSPNSSMPPAAVGAFKLAERMSVGKTQKNGSDDPRASDIESSELPVFYCGCRGLCKIAEFVPPEEVDDPNAFLAISNDVAEDLMNQDAFTGFVCADCMQEYPWILTRDLQQCMNGELPLKITDPSKILPVLPCKTFPSSHAESNKYYPYHGMIMPITTFSDRSICSCDKCQAAFAMFAPWAKSDAQYMMMNLYDECSVCKHFIGDQAAFLCTTCEVTMSDPFMLCKECNAHRLETIKGSQRTIYPLREADSHTGTGNAERSPETSTSPLSNCAPSDSVEGMGFPYVNAQGVQVTYDHDLSHQFMEDTVENLYALCGMQIADSIDEEDRKYVLDNVHEIKSITPNIAMEANFGPQPIEFTQEELSAFAIANAPHVPKEGKIE